MSSPAGQNARNFSTFTISSQLRQKPQHESARHTGVFAGKTVPAGCCKQWPRFRANGILSFTGGHDILIAERNGSSHRPRRGHKIEKHIPQTALHATVPPGAGRPQKGGLFSCKWTLVSTASMNAHIPAPSRTAVFPMTSAPKRPGGRIITAGIPHC